MHNHKRDKALNKIAVTSIHTRHLSMVEKNYKTPRTNIVQDVPQKSKFNDLAMHHKLVCCLMGVEHKSFVLGDKIVHD